MPQQPASTARPAAPTQAAPSATAGEAHAAAVVSAPSSRKPLSGKQPQQLAAPSKQATTESETVVENSLYRITFTNRGAQVKHWVLKKFQDDLGQPLDLVNSSASARYGYPLSLWTYDQALRDKLNSVLFVPSVTGTTISAPAALAFEYSDGSLAVRKTFHFDDTYVISLDVSAFQSGAPLYAFPAWPSGFGDQATLPAFAAS